jgi:hypothetical protein
LPERRAFRNTSNEDTMAFLTTGIVDDAFRRAPQCLQIAASCLARRERPSNATIADIQRQFSIAQNEESFQVFLSHAASAADKALGVWPIMSEPPYKFRAYLDWIYDPLLERDAVTPETASILRRRMQASQCLIYVVTRDSQHSVWMPWELGYFDAYKANIGVLPVLEGDSETAFSGREYLSLYTPVTLEDAAAMTTKQSALPAGGADFQRAAQELAEAAQLDLNEFVRRMQDQPRLAGEWLRPHARATIAQGPQMTTSEPEQATAEVKSIASIYLDEWMKVLRIYSDEWMKVLRVWTNDRAS